MKGTAMDNERLGEEDEFEPDEDAEIEDDPEWESIKDFLHGYEDHKDDERQDNGPSEHEIEEMEIEKDIERMEAEQRGEVF